MRKLDDDKQKTQEIAENDREIIRLKSVLRK